MLSIFKLADIVTSQVPVGIPSTLVVGVLVSCCIYDYQELLVIPKTCIGQDWYLLCLNLV